MTEKKTTKTDKATVSESKSLTKKTKSVSKEKIESPALKVKKNTEIENQKNPKSQALGEKKVKKTSIKKSGTPKISTGKSSNTNYGRGTRKSALAVARLIETEEKGVVLVNGIDYKKYFSKASDQATALASMLSVQEIFGTHSFSVKTYGGGTSGQSSAVSLAIAKAIAKSSEEARLSLRKNGFLTTDDRKVESKKAGHKKARKQKQWSKR